MRLIFMGTPEFAVKSLELLHSSKHDVLAVVTSPDKPRGRGRKVSPTAVKQKATELGLTVLQPENLKDEKFVEELKILNPDLIVVVAFRILPEAVFSLPRYGSINLHASLLPDYRGAAPINRVLINGETKTGLTTFFLNKKVDTGDILLKCEVDIGYDDDFKSLHDKLMVEGAELLVDTVDGIESGNLKSQPQNRMIGAAAPKLTSETGLIDWGLPAEKIRNLIRGLSPYPGAYTFFNKKRLIVLKVDVIKENTDKVPGTIIESNPKKGLTVACGQNMLFLKSLKPQGKKMMSSAEFVRGYNVEAGSKLTG